MKGQGRVESRSMSCIDSVWVWALSSDFGGHTYVEGSTAEEFEGALAHTVLLDVLHPKPYDLRLFRRASARPVSLGPVLPAGPRESRWGQHRERNAKQRPTNDSFMVRVRRVTGRVKIKIDVYFCRAPLVRPVVSHSTPPQGIACSVVIARKCLQTPGRQESQSVVRPQAKALPGCAVHRYAHTAAGVTITS